MWTSLGAAYDALSPPMQNLVNDLSALHDALPHNQPEKMAVHPVVRRHPRTGRKCLYVSEHFTRRIVEMDHKESDMLLRYLTRHVQGDVVLARRQGDAHDGFENEHAQIQVRTSVLRDAILHLLFARHP